MELKKVVTQKPTLIKSGGNVYSMSSDAAHVIENGKKISSGKGIKKTAGAYHATRIQEEKSREGVKPANRYITLFDQP